MASRSTLRENWFRVKWWHEITTLCGWNYHRGKFLLVSNTIDCFSWAWLSRKRPTSVFPTIFVYKKDVKVYPLQTKWIRWLVSFSGNKMDSLGPWRPCRMFRFMKLQLGWNNGQWWGLPSFISKHFDLQLASDLATTSSTYVQFIIHAIRINLVNKNMCHQVLHWIFDAGSMKPPCHGLLWLPWKRITLS